MVRREDSDEARQERERLRLIEEAKNKPSINKADAYFRGIMGILSANEEILTAAIKGSNEDFLEVSSKMSDSELAGDIALFVAFSMAGKVGNKLGKGKANPKGGRTTTFDKVTEFARRQGFKLAKEIKPKVEAEIERVNKLSNIEQQDGIMKIRQRSLETAKELLKTTKNATERFKLKADIEGIKRNIANSAKEIQEAGLRDQIENLNKLDRKIQFKLDAGKIVRDSAKELQNQVEDLNKDGGYLGKIKYVIKNGEIVIDREKADPNVEKTNLDKVDENIRQAQELIRRDELAKEAREQAKAEDKAIDDDPYFDDEKGSPDGDEVIETKEKLNSRDKPNFDDPDGAIDEPAVERVKTDKELIDEAIDKAEAKEATDSATKKVGGAGAGAAVVTNALVNALSGDGDDNDNPEFVEEPPVIPMDLMEELPEELPTDDTPIAKPTIDDEPLAVPTKKDIALNSSISSYNHNAKTKPYNIKRTITSKNIDELFLRVLDLCEDSYQKETRYETDKYFIDGTFPVLLNRQGDTIYVIFRGTNRDFSTWNGSLNSISNMISDLATWDGTGRDQNIKYSTLVEQALLSEGDRDMGGHGGFIKELAKYYKAIADEIQLYDGVCNHVVLGGHSAGGALATLFYYVYANDRNLKSKIGVEYCITYGSPRTILNKHEYITKFNNSCPSYYRVFNVNDVVSYVPFNKGSFFETDIASGFTHVGLPMCLDSNIDDNSLNALILQVVKGNVNKFDEVFLNYSLEEIRQNKLIEFITSDKYLTLMSDALFQCYSNVGVRENVSDEMLMLYARELMSNSEKLLDYGLKCDLLEPLTLSDMMKANNIGENEAQENVTIASFGGTLLGFNKMSVKAHLFPDYRDNLNLRVDREVLDKTPFLEDFKYESSLPKEVTPQSVEIDLMESIQKDIDSGKILGITTSDFESGNLFIFRE
jgi:hypothetical protein